MPNDTPPATDAQVAELERIAKAASQCEWVSCHKVGRYPHVHIGENECLSPRYYKPDKYGDSFLKRDNSFVVNVAPDGADMDEFNGNGRHIAAFGPPTALSLLARIRTESAARASAEAERTTATKEYREYAEWLQEQCNSAVDDMHGNFKMFLSANSKKRAERKLRRHLSRQLATANERIGAMEEAIKAYNMNTRYLVSYVQSFIAHAKDPEFSRLPDLKEAESEWRKANNHNVSVHKTLLTTEATHD